MSFLINPYSITSGTITQLGTTLFRSTGNPGSSVSTNITMTNNAFRVYIVHWEFINPVTLTNCVVNGLNPTIIAQTYITQGSGGVGIALLQLRYPFASSTQSFTMNFSNNVTSCSLNAYTIFRNSSDTPYSFQTATKDTTSSVAFLGVPVPPNSLNIIASTNLVNASITMSVSPSPPTLTLGYNSSVPATSSQFQQAASGIVNATATNYDVPIVSVSSSIASGVYATVTYI